jgi:hypothetical protein
MSNHTPAPWKAVYFGKTTFSDWCGWYIQRANGVGLAKIATIDSIDYLTGTECRANARLIAAAPDLLEALEKIAAEPCDHGPAPLCPREIAQSALKKAKE